MKKVSSLIIATCMLLCSSGILATEISSDDWSKYITYNSMPFKPVDNYYSTQNSPDFTWPYVENATYELVLARDKELTEIAYRKTDLKRNCYTFNHTLETGVEYYWSVRYTTGKRVSGWSEPKRLMIDEEAVEYTVPELSEISSKLRKNPVIFRDDVFEKLRNVDKTSKEFISFQGTVDNYLTNDIPVYKTTDSRISEVYSIPGRRAASAAYMYMFTGDTKYSDYVVRVIEAMKNVDPTKLFSWGSGGSDGGDDREEAFFAHYFSLAYDAVYDVLTNEQKKLAVKIIERHLERPFKELGEDSPHSLYKNPYNSHGWGLNRALLAAMIIYHDSDLAKRIVDWQLPVYASVTYPYAYQDGASVQGQFYGIPEDVAPISGYIDKTGLVNVQHRAYFQNAMLNLMYLWPPGWVATQGDMFGNVFYDSAKPHQVGMTKNVSLLASSEFINNRYSGIAKWYLKRINNDSEQYFGKDPMYNANGSIKEELPVMLPSAKYFPDTEYVAIHSDLQDNNRIGIIFHSTWYGSYNHAHPDQNSFVLDAYGEEILSDSDYYVSYGDAFDLTYNRKTHVHNAITYNGGKGQANWDIDADGTITDFINQSKFSLASGDATPAYKDAISKAGRDIIRITPSTFIVIDDLAAREGAKSTFEYWLNTRGDIGFHEDGKGATITGDTSSVEVRIQYPEKVESNYIDIWAGADLNEVNVYDKIKNNTDKRLYFKTPAVSSTKLITTLDVNRAGETELKEIKSQKYEDYMKLSFEDGSVAFINLTNAEKVVTAEGIEFSGAALVCNADSIMLVRGTNVKLDGKDLIVSENPVSIAFGKEEICISSIRKDANIKIYGTDKYEKLIKHADAFLYDIPEGKKSHGLLWENSDDYLEIFAYPGTYTLYTDKRILPGKNGSGELKIITGDETNTFSYNGAYNSEGQLTGTCYPKNYKGVYLFEDASDNVSAGDIKKGQYIDISDDFYVYVRGEDPWIKLSPLDAEEYEVESTEDSTDVSDSVDTKILAANYNYGGEGTQPVRWNKTQNNTLQYFDNIGQTVGWDIDVPEDGKYDIIMSVSTVDGVTSNKVFKLDDNTGMFNVPPTAVYSDLQGLRVKCGIELKAGKNKLELINIDNYRCIFDWIGLIKSDK